MLEITFPKRFSGVPRLLHIKGEEDDMTEWHEGELDANGITIHYYRSDGGNKPSILLLHGITR